MLPLVVIHGNNKNTAQHQCRTTTTTDQLSLMATKRETFQDWLKSNPIVTELYGDLPESYLRYMHFQSTRRGAK